MKKFIIIIVGTIILGTCLWLVLTLKFTSWDFRNNLWAPAHLLWQGAPAYEITDLFPDSNAIWFPQIITLFLPLGLLSQFQATNIWIVMNVVLLAFVIWFSVWQTKQEKPNPWILFAVLLSAYIFPPTITHLMLGQIDIFTVFAILAGTYALERNKLVLGGFLYSIALAKPQLGILVLPSLIVYMIFKKREIRNALMLILYIGSFLLIMTIPLWISNSLWINSIWENLIRNPEWLQPSLFTYLRIHAGFPGIILWALFFVVFFKLSMDLWLKYSPIRAVSWILALTTIISPYVWSWDFILLLPLLIDTAIRVENSLSRAFLAGVNVLCVTFSLVPIWDSLKYGNAVFWWIPPVLVTAVVVSLKLSGAPKKTS